MWHSCVWLHTNPSSYTHNGDDTRPRHVVGYLFHIQSRPYRQMAPLGTSCRSGWTEHTLKTTAVNNFGCYGASSQTYTLRFETGHFTRIKQKLEIVLHFQVISFGVETHWRNVWINNKYIRTITFEKFSMGLSYVSHFAAQTGTAFVGRNKKLTTYVNIHRLHLKNFVYKYYFT